jgi:hypothetical protein
MDYNLVSKNNIGVVGTLILAIFLSQSRSIDFLFRTVLGRLTLIVLILAMSYSNKILGVVGVLFVVIICSSTNIEGLDNMETTTTTDTTVTDTTITVPDTTAEATGTDAKGTNTIVKKDKKGVSSVSGTPIDEAQTGVTEDTNTEDITTANAGENVDTTENAAVEGFDIIGLERNMQKGKDSNKIPVNHNNDMENILPGDFSKIGFSLF